MGTHRIDILGWNTKPDNTGNVFFEPYTIKATNDVWDHMVAVFNDTATRDSLYGKFTVPQNYVGNPRIIVVWTSTAVAGNVVWDFDYRAVGGNDSESLDQAGTQESVSVTDAAPTATDNRLEAQQNLTAGNFAAGDTVEFLLARDGADVSDTMAAAATVHSVLFEYTDV